MRNATRSQTPSLLAATLQRLLGCLLIGLLIVAGAWSCGRSTQSSHERVGFPSSGTAVVACEGLDPLLHADFLALPTVGQGDFPEIENWLAELNDAGRIVPRLSDYRVLNDELGESKLATITDHGIGDSLLSVPASGSNISQETRVMTCDVRLALDAGYSYVDISFNPESPPASSDTAIHLLIVALDCGVEPWSSDRLRAFLVESDDAVTVKIVGIEQDDERHCREAAPTPVLIELSEAIGDRMLLDGTYEPPSPIQHPIASRTSLGTGDVPG